ncbi:MAG: Gfo/Idh/MocA family oxidoreductase [Bryobacterales bacterium]|nr:Gfo/Idh/MocA family oxidoreductase [Bryobacterales bacterium]
MAIAALRAGKHVRMEKPIGLVCEEATKVQAPARESGRVLAVGRQR